MAGFDPLPVLQTMNATSFITKAGFLPGLPALLYHHRLSLAWVAGFLCMAVSQAALLAQTPITQEAYLKAHNTPGFRRFGSSVAASGDTVVASASVVNTSFEQGGFYVFVRNGATWTQQAHIQGNAMAGVAISGDTIAVGAAFEDSSTTGVNGVQTNTGAADSGAAYVYVRNGTTWSPQAYLKASNTGAGDLFGSIAISGDTIVVGASQEDSSAAGMNGDQANNSATESGAAYVFVRNGTTWTQQAYLKASNASKDDGFGISVGISGDTVVVGAWGEDSSAPGVNGNQANNSATDSGAAYVFARNGTTWSQQAYLKASNPGGPTAGDFPAAYGDFFGGSVAISGDTIVVGAFTEDSNATGVGGNQTNNGVHNAGAAYIFVRDGTTWSQQAYLKASNTTPGDVSGPQFGFAVTISETQDMVAIGAPYEDSSGSGVNGIQNIYSSRDSGAAYVFERRGTAWSPRAYLKASNAGPDNQFGSSLALSGGTLIVGAYQEDSSTTGVNSIPNNNSPANFGAAYVFTGLLPPPPALAIQSSDNGFRLSWPLSSSGWLLEQSDTMESAAWLPIPAPYESDVTGFFHTVPNTAARGFFRLRKP